MSHMIATNGVLVNSQESPVIRVDYGVVAERQFRKVQGYREIPSLMNALANTVSKKAVAEEVKVA
jgi:hypothetical protein